MEMIYDEILEDQEHGTPSAMKQEALIMQYCAGIEQEVAQSHSLTEAREIAATYCQQFALHCSSSVLRSAAKEYVDRVVNRRWTSNDY
ncbi:MAG: hypothetical protein WCW40_00355 [Bacteroidota bacterium]